MPKAYSYARFSSKGQADGHSLKRQIEIATSYHARVLSHLPLDTSRCDEGFSAYKGHQISKGSLGHFIAEILAGTIEVGSALIAENLDRISREGPKIARKRIEKIVDNGIEVHVVNVNVILTPGWENDWRRYPVDSELERAWKESLYKVDRIGKAWQAKKAALATGGKIFTRNLPAWLRVENGKIVEKPEEVEIVRRVFELAANGLGSKNIARALNGFDRTVSWITKTLSNRAVLGEFQPHSLKDGKRIPDGEPVYDYYPRIIPDDLWRSARFEVERKNRWDPDTRRQRLRSGARNSNRADNLFSGLIYDEKGRSMWFQRKSEHLNAFLISSWTEGAKGYRLRYDWLEKNILHWLLNQCDFGLLSAKGNGPELTAKLAQLSSLNDALATAKAKVDARNSALEALDDVAAISVLARQVAKLEADAAALEGERETLAAEVETLKAKQAVLDNPEKLLREIRDDKDNDRRLRLRSEIRRTIRRIELDFSGKLIPGLVVITFTFINDVKLGGDVSLAGLAIRAKEVANNR